MKRIYRYGSMLGAMAIVMAGCTADEVISLNESDTSINFNVNTANLTRANSYCNVSLPDHFNVWADYVGGDGNKVLFYDGDKIVKTDGSSYRGEKPRFWPSDVSAMSFYAYADGARADGSDSFVYSRADGKHKFQDYTINPTVSEQQDLMYAVNTNVSGPATGQTDMTVALNFRHALSQICFKAQNQNPNIKITVNSVTIHGLVDKGTYTFPTESTGGNYEHHTDVVDAGGRNLNRGEWALSTADGDKNKEYSVSFGEGCVLTTPDKGATTFVSDNLTAPEVADGVHANFEKALNLLPQEQTAATAADNATVPTGGVYFTLNLSIKNLAKSDAENALVDETDVVSTGKDYYVPAHIDWEEGYRYIYTFKFHPRWDYANASTIEYDVTADDFNPEEGESGKEEAKAPEGASEIQITDDEGNPTGKYFAEMNLGAKTPYESGLYFWWGDNTGFDKSTKTAEEAQAYFSSTNSTALNIISNIDTYVEEYSGYEISVSSLTENETNNKRLKSDESVNPAFNLGKGWRIPTVEELHWVMNKEKFDWKLKEDENGKYYEVKEKTSNNTMIVPVAGRYNDQGNFDNKTRLWSSTKHKTKDTQAYSISYDSSDNTKIITSASVYNGVPIRPIYDPELAAQQEAEGK